MRYRATLLALFAAVALSSAPAEASPPLLSCGGPCDSLLPTYWEDPNQPICKALLAISCGWY
jgi:hypothetical protein